MATTHTSIHHLQGLEAKHELRVIMFDTMPKAN
jgi:hypothetical protein